MTFLEFETEAFGQNHKFLVQLAAIQVVEPRKGYNDRCNLKLSDGAEPLLVFGSYKEIRERIRAAEQAIV